MRRRRRRRLRGLLVLSCALASTWAAAACTGDEFSGSGAAGDGGSAADASATTDAPSSSDAAGEGAADAGDDAGGVVLLDDGFESNADCDGWKAPGGTAIPWTPGRIGARCCKVCLPSNGGFYKRATLPAAGSGTFPFDVWMRATEPGDDAGAPATKYSFSFGGYLADADGGVEYDSLYDQPMPNVFVDESFSPRTDAPTTDTIMYIYLHAPDAGTACALIDEARLRYQP